MYGTTAMASSESTASMRHRMANMATRLMTEEANGNNASLTMMETQVQSAVTRRMLSPTDLRA